MKCKKVEVSSIYIKFLLSQYKNTNNLVEKWAKDMNIELMEINIQMAVFCMLEKNV